MTGYTFPQLIDFTRTSAATYVNSSGNIASTPQSRNLLTFTNEFSNAAWTKSNSQIVPNVNPAAASLGAELVTNGDFASGTGWTANAGWAIGSGVATATSTSTSLFGGGFTPTAGRLYRVDFDVVSYTSGTLAITVGANYTGESSLTGGAMAAGRKTVYVVSGTNTSRGVEFYGGAISAVIDNVSVREVIGGALQAPDGTFTADTLVEDTTNAAHTVSSGNATVALGAVTWSVYAKAGTRSWMWLNAFAGGNNRTWFNLANGTVGTTGAGATASITSVGNGWYRCSVTLTSGTTTVSMGINSASADNTTSYAGTSGAGAIFIWGAQLEQASAATDYTRNFGGLFPPRFDYDPVTRAPRGLLIEEQRTNLLVRSQEFDNAFWQKTNITVTSAATASPDGTNNAQRVEVTTTANANIFSTSAAVAATSATYSVYVKQGTGPTTANTFAIRNTTTATTLLMVTVNFSTGSVISYINGTTGASLQNAGNGWWRVVLTVTSGLTSGDTVACYPGFVGGAQTAGDHIFLYGAQLEAGAFATSYIPTVASQVTRTSDQAAINAPNFASWFNGVEGSLLAEAVPYLVTGNGGFASLNGGSGSNRIDIRRDGFALVDAGGVSQASLSVAGMAANQVNKLALAYKANDFALVRNGGTPSTDASGSVPTVSLLQIGGLDSNPALGLNGWVRSIRFYPVRLTNAQLQALTA